MILLFFLQFGDSCNFSAFFQLFIVTHKFAGVDLRNTISLNYVLILHLVADLFPVRYCFVINDDFCYDHSLIFLLCYLQEKQL